jgi:MYXO-CTERM domain-containing protein
VITVEGNVADITGSGESKDVPAGDCKTDNGLIVGPCQFTPQQIANDPFIISSIQADANEKGFQDLNTHNIFLGSPPPSPPASSTPQALGTGCGQSASDTQTPSKTGVAAVIAMAAVAFFGSRRRRSRRAAQTLTEADAFWAPPLRPTDDD